MAVRSTPSRVGCFVLVGRLLRVYTEGVEDENRVTQGISACRVGDPDDLL